jgi:acetyltransferase-like isoleucine patch superfamily enzyme
MERLLMAKLRQSDSRFWSWLYRGLKAVRSANLPRLRALGSVLALERRLRQSAWHWVRNQYCNQIMASRCDQLGQHVQWDGDVPLVYGDGHIHIGDHVHVGNRQTWVVGLKVYNDARLSIGDYTTINYQTLISVAKEVRIGRYCALAGEIKIFDNNSHSLDWVARRAHLPITEADVAPVVIEDDVWIGNNCIILKGVHVGRGAVIAAGSVVTHDVPEFTLVAGVPARPIKTLPAAGKGVA